MESHQAIGNDKQSEEPSPEPNHKNPSNLSIEVPAPGLKVHIGNNSKDEETNEGKKEAKNDGSESNVEVSASCLSRSSSSSSSSSDNNEDKAEQEGYQSPEPDMPQWSMVSASPRGSGPLNLPSSDGLSRTPDWVMFQSSMMKSPPPIQAMGRGYDPNRIPSSIFSTKPGTPLDWSVASNESLFSIHMGNNSFSRDSAILQGLEFGGKPEDWSNVSEPKLSESNSYTPNLPPVEETPRRSDSSRPSNVYVRPGLEEELGETPKVARGGTGEDHSQEKPRLSTSSAFSDGKGIGPRKSNESTQSSDSFAFPVLLGEGVKENSLKVPPTEKPPQTPESKSQEEDPKPSEATETQPPPAAGTASWFSCLRCWPMTTCC
ncbi:OLC1v1009755C1 [Oldenlandia corymbosa var. corymbosa]|uniref:OLC1v1009755C1 n=1 Tax=Oldenlandia corymbosa var. corymbosa TaxID=529605 RepID=A0AAV1DSN0_OLDCO|nr:OLC1v1009755C1 [Oldenlandia corymbosa var. corymbosa]